MQSHHDAAPARPTAEWINRYAADLLAAAPGMLPLEAVRKAMEATTGRAADGRQRPSSSGAPLPPSGRGHAP